MPPYGLRYREAIDILPSGKTVTRTAGYAEDPATIGTVRRIFHDCDSGMSLRAISRGLAADGILPPFHSRTGGERWGPATLRRILTNRVYVGEVVAFRYECYAAMATDGSNRKTKRHHERPAEEQIPLPGDCAPTIIDLLLFARVQARLEQNREQATDFRETRNPEVGILRRGLAFCATCGARLVVMSEGGGPTYRCSGRERTGCTARGGIRVDRLDPAIWDWLTGVLSNEDRVRRYLDDMRDDDPTVDDLAAVARQRREVERQQSKFVAVIEQLEDPESAGPIAAKLDALNKQLKGLARDEADLLARRDAWQRSQIATDDILAKCRRIAGDMGRITTWADQRAMAYALKIRVDVGPGGTWTARSEIVPDAASGDSNLFTTRASSTRGSTTSSCSVHPPTSSWSD